MDSLRVIYEQERRLKEQQGLLMVKEMEMRKLEEERALVRKQQEQRIVRYELDKFNKAKIAQR